jgi:PAS domain S-box-containing protein
VRSSVFRGVRVRDEDKTNEQLIAELRAVREQLAAFRRSVVPEPQAPEDTAGHVARHRAVTEDQRLVCRWRPDGILTFVSEAYCRYFGKGRDELIDRSLWPLVAEVDRARVMEHVRRLGPHNPAGILEHRVIGLGGQVRWHLRVDQVLAEEKGQPAEFETVARDITEQQQLRAELRTREASIRAFFECATEGIVGVNRDGQIVLANPRAEALFGYEREELVGRRLEVLIPDRGRPIHGQHQADYFARPRTRSMGLGLTLTGRRKDGTEFPIEVSLTYLPDEAGGLAMAFVTDISERVAHERQARHVEKLAALGSLAAGIAHELNNPIGIILSRIELMLMEAEEQPPATESVTDLQVLHRHAQRLGHIAQRLLSFGRQRQRDRQPLNLSEVVDDTLLLAGKQLSREGIHVLTRLDASLPRMLGDPTALEQVLLNLLLNARDAMPTGGTVEIETSTDPAQPGVIRLVVSDTGHGMPPEILAKVSEPFFTTKPSGSGLGLSVSYTIIREHGGTVDVRSEPGRGTTFTLRFPPA